MQFRRTFLILIGLSVLCVSAIGAGDSASFVNLGFSPDGSIYMFAQYGVKSGVLRPWADIYVVDVAKNDFVSGGRISHTYDRPIDAGQDGMGMLYSLIAENAGLARRYGVNFPNQGQPLYIALDGDPAYAGEPIQFRDFVSGISYQASVIESVNGSGKDLRSSFYIRLEYLDEGVEKVFVIGSPEIKRPLVSSYRIKKVLIDPSGSSLVFVIEMKRHAEDGYDIRYMVEVLRL